MVPRVKLTEDQLDANIERLHEKKRILGKKLSESEYYELMRLNRVKNSRTYRKKEKEQKHQLVLDVN